MNDENTPLRMTGISKRFGGFAALENVDLTLNRGEVHALVGENGAGKSTLIKIMTGAYRPDGGWMEMQGERVSFHSPGAAQRAGVVAIYQEVSLLRYRTVAENIYLGREPKRFGLVDKRSMNRRAGEALESLGLGIDPQTPIGELSTALRQMVAITRGVCLSAKVLVFDEPTSSITEQETAILFRVIRDLQARGTSIVYISHRMEELYSICQTVTVLRDGKVVTSGALAGIPRLDLIRAMLGKERVSDIRNTLAERIAAPSSPVLELARVSAGKPLRDVSLQVSRGEDRRDCRASGFRPQRDGPSCLRGGSPRWGQRCARRSCLPAFLSFGRHPCGSGVCLGGSKAGRHRR